MAGESNLHLLFEHAVGYSMFKIKEFEEESMFMSQVEQSVVDFPRFKAIVKLVNCSPFKTAQSTLENLNSLTEGIIPEDLKYFISQSGVKGIVYGISDTKLANSLQEAFPKIKLRSGALINEITRGVRTHFHKLIDGLTLEAAGKAQQSLGHSYSRSKVKYNVNRADNMIIQGIALLDQLDKDINTFSMRIREWYSYHFPELIKIVPDNYMYARVVYFIKDKKDFNEDKLEALEEIVCDSMKAKACLDAARSSMGMDISPIDLINIESFASRVIKLAEYRRTLQEYLQNKMNAVAPNLTSLLGETVAARLISHAGSLTNLAKFPASTVQILGAEKALFRALKTRGKTPKYGLLFHSTFIGRAAASNKGRISRFLANKCSIASRIDCFTDMPSTTFGKMLRDQVEERLKFYETGDIPRKNADVMKEAMSESMLENESQSGEGGKKKKKKKKKKNKDLEENGGGEEEAEVETNGEVDVVVSEKKKKRKHSEIEDDDENDGLPIQTIVTTSESKKKKKKVSMVCQ